MKSDEFQSEKFIRARAVAREIKKGFAPRLLVDPNCVGVGFGQRVVQGEATGSPALVVYVIRKVPSQFIPLSRRLPRRIYAGHDCVEVDVVETGPIYPLAFTARERPAPSGISIGHPAITAGTLGCLVTDNTDGSTCILSNNHVIANQNAASIGDATIQPGTFDGGSSPGDNIATLKRFVRINATGNTVDGAIAQVDATVANNVVDQMKNNLMPVPSPGHPAVGLLFAGSCNRTIMNPINDVVNQLNISFPAGPGSISAVEIGTDVEKVGRTTEYTTSTITEVDLTVTIPYDFGSATFDDQIATAWMSDGGDSGSVVCQGGAGGSEDHCGCGTSTAAAGLLGVDLKPDVCMAQEVRDKFLRQTRIGRWAVDLFALNEERFLERFRGTEIKEVDRTHARKIYSKYVDEARAAFIEVDNPDRRLTEQHLRDATSGFGRLKKYLRKDEVVAGERMLEMAHKAVGANAREVLAMLNDESLFAEVKKIAESVSTIRTKDRCCED